VETIFMQKLQQAFSWRRSAATTAGLLAMIAPTLQAQDSLKRPAVLPDAWTSDGTPERAQA
jgi:hypothetical protein